MMSMLPWITRFLALALIVLHLATPLFSEEAAWGLWPYTYLPPAWRWGLALAAALTCIPTVNRAFRRVLLLIPYPLSSASSRLQKLLFFAVLSLACAPLFWLARIVHTRWGDAYILVHAIPHPQVRLTYNWQAPLDVFLHAKFWALGHQLWGWADAMPAYWVLSTAAGVLFIFILFWLADWLGRNQAEKALTFGLIASLGTMQLFFGYVENYTLICVGILLYLCLALRRLRGEMGLLWPALSLALTNAFHPSTLVLWPSAILLLRNPFSRKDRVFEAEELFKLVLPPLAVGLLVLLLMESGGHGLEALLGADFPGGGDRRWLVPLFQTTTRWEHYTLFSWLHLRDILNEQLLIAPVTLPMLGLTIALRFKQVNWRDPLLLFLVVSAGCYLLLTMVWNPDYGGQRDWDLFAPAAIPLTLFLGYILPRVLEDETLADAGLILVVTSLIHTAAWVYQNTRPWSWPI